MNHRLAFLAAMSLLPVAAQAQSSVTLYGVVDDGIEYINHLPRSGGGSGTAVRMSAGNQSTSRWGLRGREDLGTGLAAVFQLENGFDADTGLANQGGRMFGRQAYVGLTNRYGTLSLGRHQNLLYDFSTPFDPLSVSTRYSLLSHDRWMSSRSDNSIKFTGETGAIYYGVLYSTGYDSTAGGEIPGASKAGREMSGAVGYTSGPFTSRLVYDELRGSTLALDRNTERRAAISGIYTIGAAKVYAGYRWYYGNYQTSELRTNLYWLGLQYQATPNLSVTGAAYYTDVRNTAADPFSFVLQTSYAFSKRTDLYTSLGYVWNRHGSSLGLGGFGPSLTRAPNTLTTTAEQTVAGQSQLGAVVGIRHRF
ncbi:porin [Cupriavidus sp. CuC1]|uniref:porin n=1 Tax=Cupriavidus sp. CuC1 TaxID=3373131 RepID=UPI0037D5C482